jgi:hypothetical protein
VFLSQKLHQQETHQLTQQKYGGRLEKKGEIRENAQTQDTEQNPWQMNEPTTAAFFIVYFLYLWISSLAAHNPGSNK